MTKENIEVSPLVSRYTSWKHRSKTTYKKKYVVCFLSSDKGLLDEKRESILGLFEYEYRRLLCDRNLHLIVAPDIDFGIKKALEVENFEYEFVVFLNLGNDLKDFFDILDSKITEDLGLMGNILDRNKRGRYFELHDQAVVVNRKYCEELSKIPFRPRQGNYFLVELERSQENFHDDYTPLWIKNTNKKIEIENPSPGGLWIDAIIGKAPVEPFTREMREHRKYLYPFNTKSDQLDIQSVDVGIVDPFFPVSLEPAFLESAKSFNGPIKNLYSVCSSLRCFLLLNIHGFSEETKLHFFDYSEYSLGVMKYIWEEWDGSDYPKLIKSLRNLAKSVHEDTLADYWNFFLSQYGGEGKWKENLKEMRNKISVKFSNVNLLESSFFDDYLQGTGDGSRDYLWISNCYNYKPTSLFSDRSKMYSSSYSLLTQLREKKPEAFFDGFNPYQCLIGGSVAKNIHLCKSLNFENAKEYSDTFQFIQRNMSEKPENRVKLKEYKPKKLSDLSNPYLSLNIDFPATAVLDEVLKVDNSFVTHRKDGSGWSSVAVHGISSDKTLSHKDYGYSFEDEVPYQWTEIAEQTPVLKNWIVENLVEDRKLFTKLYRVRIMKLNPNGHIPVHRDRNPEARCFGALNIAVNNPQDCLMAFEDYGIVPWEGGKSFFLDTSYRHAVANGSLESRYHIIVHGKINLTKSGIYG